MKLLKPDIVFCYEKNCGGETVVTEDIINEIKKKGNKEIKVVILDPLKKTNFISYFRWIMENVVRSLLLTIKIKPKVLYTVTFTAGVAAVILKPVLKHKVVFHYHGSRVPPKTDRGLHGYHNFTQKIKYKTTYWLHKIFIANADLIIVPSQFTKTKFLKEFPFAGKEIIKIVSNGVDTIRFRPVSLTIKLTLRKKLGIKKGSKIILYSGRIDKNKNIQQIIKTAHLLKKDYKNLVLIIAYPKTVRDEEKELLKKLKLLTTKLKLNNFVLFIENYTKIQELYQISDLAISLSIKENFPIALLEAFACKTMYVAYPAGFINDFLLKINESLIINKVDTRQVAKRLKSVFSLPSFQKENIRSKGYTATRKYTRVNMVRKIETLILQII